MGLFKKSKTSSKMQKTAQPDKVAEQVFDDAYREELRQMGRDHFKKLLESNSVDLKSEVDATMEQLTGSLRRHMASQLDLAITRVNGEISRQLKETMSEYNRVSSEAQELVIQSLSRNAQSVHEKYQQMSANLQEVVANQEVMMVGVFQDNQSRVSTIQAEQDRAMSELRDSISRSRQQSEEITKSIQASADEQSHKIDEIYRENIDKASEMRRMQEEAIGSFSQSVKSVEEQHDKFEEILRDAVAKYRTMATERINDDMARIIEHYLVDALGERSDVVRDLPNILERLEDNKQAMLDDMKL